jgi:hypothetical protein
MRAGRTQIRHQKSTGGKMTTPIRPQDILPDGQDSAVVGSTTVRKGSVAAFMANARLLDQTEPGSPDAEILGAELRELAGPLEALGLFEVFEIRSARVAEAIGARS